MSTDYPAEILNHDGSEVELEGRINFTDPANAPGGSQPIVSGAGSPVDSVTPTAGKPVYIDTTNGAIYLAMGPTDADWIEVGTGAASGNIGSTTGIIWSADTRAVYILGGERDTPLGFGYLGDAYSMWNGNSEGLAWNRQSATSTELRVRTIGADGQHNGTLQDDNGTMTLADGGLIFPSADPHVIGAWWDNAGVLTKSAG